MMSNPDGTFIYIGTYPDETAARVDHAVDAVGSFDAAVVTKDDKGKIHVNKDETATRAGGWIGVGVGALVGILFPPAILASAAVGGVIGGVTGHLWKGMSRADVKELGDTIDAGEAALVVIGELTVSEALQKAELHALKETKKEVDASFKELERAIKAQ